MKVYLHDAAHGLSGTFPSGEQDSQAPDWSATGATTLRRADMAPDTAMVGRAGTTAATTSAQAGFMGFWALPPLSGAQTVGGGGETILVNVAIKESDLNANLLIACHAYVWRPSTNSLIGDLCSFATAAIDSPVEPTSANSIQVCNASYALSSVAAADGDVIIVEIWAKQTQSSATNYTATLYYGGETETALEGTVVTNHASYIDLSQTLTFQATTAAVTGINVEAVVSEDVVAAAVTGINVEAVVSEDVVTAAVTGINVEVVVSEAVVTSNVSALFVEVLYELVLNSVLDAAGVATASFDSIAAIPAELVSTGLAIFDFRSTADWADLFSNGASYADFITDSLAISESVLNVQGSSSALFYGCPTWAANSNDCPTWDSFDSPCSC